MRRSRGLARPLIPSRALSARGARTPGHPRGRSRYGQAAKDGNLYKASHAQRGPMDLAYYGDPRGLYVICQKAAESEPNKPKKLSWQTRKKITIEDGLLTQSSLVCGDLNNDGMVNSLDWSSMNSNWFSNVYPSDINQDGVVNSIDFSWMNKNWLLADA